jgi:hypothetical protein
MHSCHYGIGNLFLKEKELAQKLEEQTCGAAISDCASPPNPP